MQDEIQKRNTDCVYFLASPLTCKKGIECEFRHSESARLNPRDCWYWLSGNCLNPTCAFRHPPLDGHTETSSEPATVPQQLTVNKTNVPCYFYFNGFCNKGDRCSFLHGPDGVSPAWKSSKTTPIVTDVHPMESKTSKGSDTGPTSIEMPPHQSKTTSKLGLNIQRKGDPQQSVPTFVEQISSPPILMPECEEAAIKSDSPPPAEDFIENQSHLSLDQSSEEQVDSHIEPEEWWESSPGFDVLVDDDSENLGYEDDPKFLLTHDMEARELHDHFLRYDYKDPAGYDPMEYPEYPDAGNLYKHERYDSYDHLENEHISDYVRRVPDRLSERMLDPMLFQKRKFLPRELKVDVPDGVDLRDHLRKRRRIDGRLVSQNPRRHGSSSLDDWSRERPANHSKGVPLRRRLASEVGKNMIGSHRENEIGQNDNHRRGWLRHSQPRRNRSRQREKEKGRQSRPRFLPSEISRGPASSETRRNVQESTAFTGPKTLAQIKEEKRKARENGDGFGNTGCSNRTTSVDFQSPRSLNEILKDKRRLGSLSDDNTSRRSKHDVEPEMNHDYQIKDENDFVDEDDEDDDGLEKKLASILS